MGSRTIVRFGFIDDSGFFNKKNILSYLSSPEEFQSGERERLVEAVGGDGDNFLLSLDGDLELIGLEGYPLFSAVLGRGI